jgi:hypothetical protein
VSEGVSIEPSYGASALHNPIASKWFQNRQPRSVSKKREHNSTGGNCHEQQCSKDLFQKNRIYCSM